MPSNVASKHYTKRVVTKRIGQSGHSSNKMEVKPSNADKIVQVNFSLRCPECPRVFRDCWVLQRHRRIHYPQPQTPPNLQTDIVCPLCSMNVKRQGGWAGHMRKHPNVTFVKVTENSLTCQKTDVKDGSGAELQQPETPSSRRKRELGF